MIFTEINFDNTKTSTSTIGIKYATELFEKLELGYTFKGIIPLKYGPSGKMLSLAMCFDDANPGKPKTPVLDEVVYDNNPKNSSELSAFEPFIEKRAGYEFIGVIPTCYGPSGKLLKAVFVFAKEK